MKLYHGMCGSNLNRLLADGLLPRHVVGTSNWEHSVPSNRHYVYLTNAYPLYFALQACKHEGVAMIAEVDTDRLDQDKLCADEDVIEQIGRGRDDLPAKWTMQRRTRYYRKRMSEYRWDTSIQAMGTCAHLGRVDLSAITRIVTIQVSDQHELCFRATDAVTTIMGYQVVGGKYRAMTRWIFGEEPDADDRRWTEPVPFPSLEKPGEIEMREQWPPSQHRRGIEIREIKSVTG